MKIELWKTGDVKPYPGNPRQNDAAVDKVAASIKEFGFRQPIVVDAEGVIIVGHTRHKAAIKLGPREGSRPRRQGPDAGPDQGLPDRRQQGGGPGQWDNELLPIELSELQGMDFDIGLLGFSEDELAKIFEPASRTD